MMHIVRLLETGSVTHDVKYFRLEKPRNYSFVPGQATDVAINYPALELELRPFTFTALEDRPYLEFTIKAYPDHHGITERLHRLEPGAELLIGEPWGAIEYKGPGYFIAGGAGITPFMAILRKLKSEDQIGENQLFFSNKTSMDIIYQQELKEIMGERVTFLLSREEAAGYYHGRINESFLKKNIQQVNRPIYVCGPDAMVQDIINLARAVGAPTEGLVFEK